MSKIYLTQNQYTTVDPADMVSLSQYKWHYGGGYARRHNGFRNTPIPMHRHLLNARKGQMIDHINGDKLDNRRSNLRFCTFAQNGQNAKTPVNNMSGYKGVTWHKRHKKWMAQIMKNGKQWCLGYFEDATEAARAYNDAAEKLHGEFARPNFNLCATS